MLYIIHCGIQFLDSIKLYCENDESEKVIIPHNDALTDNDAELNENHVVTQTYANGAQVVDRLEDPSESEDDDVCVETLPKTDGGLTGRTVEKYICTCKDQSDGCSKVLFKSSGTEEVNTVLQISSETEQVNKVSPESVAIEGVNKVKDTSSAADEGISKLTTEGDTSQTREGTNMIDCNFSAKNKTKIRNSTIIKDSTSMALAKPHHTTSKCSNSKPDIFPCLVNHSGITIRITGADSIESLDSESSKNDSYTNGNQDCFGDVQNCQPNTTVRAHSGKCRDNSFTAQNQFFILRGTKTSPKIRSQKQNKIFEPVSLNRNSPNKTINEKYITNQNAKLKTEQSTQANLEHISTKTKTSSKNTSSKSKEEERLYYKSNCCMPTRKIRPKSCVEKGSTKVRANTRPTTAPVNRTCCQWGEPHLPEYNGLRSEYGLSAEQLMERKRFAPSYFEK